MAYNPQKPQRKSIRLNGYDYSQPGAYFVTICINDGTHRLGEVQNGEMLANPAGLMVTNCWEELSSRFDHIELDVFQLMPNHIHFTLFITEMMRTARDKKVVLGNIIGAFKSITTNNYIEGVHHQNWPYFYKRVWQRDYFDRVIRNERELNAIRAYIMNNPSRWTEDKLNPTAPINKFNQHFHTNP